MRTPAGGTDPEVRRRLDHHHERLRAALRNALDTAGVLTLLAYGINLRSRAGAPAVELERTVRHKLTTL